MTEKLYFYAAPYRADELRGTSHGVAAEGEDIEVVELAVDDAVASIGTDIVDAKTILMIQWAALSGPFARR